MKTALICAVCVLVCLSCQSTTSPPIDEGFTNPVFKRDVANPGALHNEIVRQFARELDMTADDGTLTRKEFVRLMVDATNYVFQARGIPPVVTSRDINRSIDEIVDLRHRKVFDFFSSNPGDPRNILKDWQRRGIVSAEDAAAARARLDGDIPAQSQSRSKAVRGFDNVYSASKQLWSNEEIKLTRSGPQLDDGFPPKKEDLRWEIDSLFFLLGMLLSGGTGGTVAGTVGSLVIQLAPPPDLGGWDCSDYCNMG